MTLEYVGCFYLSFYENKHNYMHASLIISKRMHTKTV